MSENKTKPTDASVEDYIVARGSEQQRADCRELIALLEQATQQPPRMWGPSIVGFGSYRYTYESGRTGEATHLLLRSADDRPIITDGLRTLERVRPIRLYALWASATAGIAALLYLLVVGGVRSVRSLCRRAWRSEPLRWPTLCLTMMLLAPVLYLTQSFLAIGDPTPANVAIALLTGMLPVTLLIAAAHRVRVGLREHLARWDFLALVGALQWCVVLAAWGLLPLALWR
jgi:hypothetical protein